MNGITKAKDVEHALMLAKSGTAFPTVDIGPGPSVRLLWPIVFTLGAINQFQQLFIGSEKRHLLTLIFLTLYCIGLVFFLIACRAKLRVSDVGFEIGSGFKRREFRYANVLGNFDLLQRKIRPGFDVVFHVREPSPAVASGSEKLVRIGNFDIGDHTLLDLLRTYKDHSLGGTTTDA